MDLLTNKKFRFENFYFLLLITFVVAIIYIDIIKKPNQFLISAGDGLKNYYTFLYHIKNDKSFWKFDGMNYPFGENIVFTDNQPILSNSIKLIHNISPSIDCNLIAIHNYFLIFGLILGGLGFFLVLRQLKIDFVFASIITIGLILLNPQIPRFNGHYGLFYPTLSWLFLFQLKILDGKKYLKYSFIISIFTVIVGLLHMYHFLLSAFVCLLFIFINLYLSFSKKDVIKAIIQFLIQIIVPFLILTFFTSITNYSTDRPNAPYGFFEFRSFWEGLIFSYQLPLFNFVNTNLVKVREINFEGKAYIGILSVFTLLSFLILIIFKFKAFKSYFSLHKIEGKFFLIFLISALISFGLPFVIPGLEFLLDYTGPFKQFRSIGRLSWICFYAINFFSIYIIYHYLIPSIKNNNYKIVTYFSILFLVFVEGVWYQNKNQYNLTNIEEYQCKFDKSKIQFNKEEYQAILPNPYFSIGSECFGWWDLGNEVNYNFELSYLFNLPTLGTVASRTPYHQAFQLNELTCKPYKIPEIINKLKEIDPRPLLVLETKNEVSEKRNNISYWTANAPVIFENEKYKLKKLDLSQFDTIVHQYLQGVKNQMDTIKNFTTTYYNLDLAKTNEKEGINYSSGLILDKKLSGRYLFSYWLEMPNSGAASSITEIWQFNENEKVTDYIGEANHFNYKMYDGNKLLIETPMNLRDDTKRIVFKVSSKDKSHSLNFSKIMLYKDGDNIKETQNGKNYFNNYLINL